METATMGRVLVRARIENLGDCYLVDRGMMAPEKVRVVEVEDALVDSGASALSLPRRMVEQLGLKPLRTRRVRTSAGVTDVTIHDCVRLTIQGRECFVDVLALPDDCPVLIGQIPLEAMDWVIDMPGRKLIGNPEHGGEQMSELFSVLPGGSLAH